MAITLHTSGLPPAPPRIIIYGPPGVGKTTFGLSAPDVVLLPFEDGVGFLRPPSVTSSGRRVLATYEDAESALHGLLTQEHSFKNVLVDSLTSMQALVSAKVAKDNGVVDPSEIPYGAGTADVASLMRSLLTSLDLLREKRGMGLIALAHATTATTDDPETAQYERVEMRLQHGKNTSVRAMCREWVEGVYYADFVKHVTTFDKGPNKGKSKAIDGRGERILRCKPHASRDGKDRNNLPNTLPFEWSAFEKAYTEAATLASPATETETNESNQS